MAEILKDGIKLWDTGDIEDGETMLATIFDELFGTGKSDLRIISEALDKLNTAMNGYKLSVNGNGTLVITDENDKTIPVGLSDANGKIAYQVDGTTLYISTDGKLHGVKIEKSNVNGNIKVDGKEMKVYSLPSTVLRVADGSKSEVSGRDMDTLDGHDASYFATKEEHDELDERVQNIEKVLITSKSYTANLSASGWKGSVPYTYELSLSNMKNWQNPDIIIAPNGFTQDQAMECANAMIIGDSFACGGSSTGKITFKAYGVKPSVNLPIKISIRGTIV